MLSFYWYLYGVIVYKEVLLSKEGGLMIKEEDVEEIVENPVEWCKRMQDEAETTEDVMNYYKLAQMWMGREKKDEHSGV